jgi:hypothetical protein
MPIPDGWFDTITFNRNRDAFPQEELQKYWGRHVAWSLDGTRILADGASAGEVYARLDELGVPPGTTVASFVPDPESSYI